MNPPPKRKLPSPRAADATRGAAVFMVALLVLATPLRPTVAADGAGMPSPPHGQSAADPRASFPRSALEIRSGQGRQWFTIRIADTPERQELGLMLLRTLPSDEGMLFPQARPQLVYMWMKNTLIPLDMLFIDSRGRIACLREQATPLSLDIITCEAPVKAVLEIGGGEAAKRGIAVGDRVLHALFGS